MDRKDLVGKVLAHPSKGATTRLDRPTRQFPLPPLQSRQISLNQRYQGIASILATSLTYNLRCESATVVNEYRVQMMIFSLSDETDRKLLSSGDWLNRNSFSVFAGGTT